MNSKNFTPIFIGVVVGLITIYDVWVIMKYGNSESISAHLLSLGEVVPFIPALLGFTFGHLTWPNRDSFLHGKSFKPYSYIFFILMGVPAIHDFYQLYVGGGNILLNGYRINSALPFLASYILGHYFWPMAPQAWSGRYNIRKRK